MTRRGRVLAGRMAALAILAALGASILASINNNPAPTAEAIAPAAAAPPKSEQAEPIAAASPEKTPPVEPSQPPSKARDAIEGTPEARVLISEDTLVPQVKRLGINFANYERWGAGNFTNNILFEPGFEGSLYGEAILVGKGATAERVPQANWSVSWNSDKSGIGQPEGFWDGASYEFATGPARGRRGTVRSFKLEQDQNVFYLDGSGPAPEEQDVLLIRRNGPSEDPDNSGPPRPGSPGAQSRHLRYAGQPWEPAYSKLTDAMSRSDASAGKLFPIRGKWRVSFWAKGKGPGTKLQAQFLRQSKEFPPFLDKSITLEEDWKEYQWEFAAPDSRDAPGGKASALAFLLTLPEEGAEAWVDDAAITRLDVRNPTAFSDAIVERLKELRPGVLRHWNEQFGSTLDNELAAPWARKATGFSPQKRKAEHYGFSLHEFLELCHYLDAEPWYAVPPTFTPEEWSQLAAYLAAPASSKEPYAQLRAKLGQAAPWTDVFPVIHIEFGNELWGAADGRDPFFGASMCGGERLGEAAARRFALFRESPYFKPDSFDLIIGGQASTAWRQKEIDDNSTAHDTIALAPYFGKLDEFGSSEAIYYPLFASPFHQVQSGPLRESQTLLDKAGRGTGLAIYEINFHTTSGTVPLRIRNDFVAGAAGALALPLHMLTYLRDFRAATQCAFNTVQFSRSIANNENVRLWGMLRDLESTGRKRPTWLGVELVNRVLSGALIRTEVQGGLRRIQPPLNGVEKETEFGLVQAFAFRDKARYGLVLFNLSLDTPQKITIELPSPPDGSAEMNQIVPASLSDTNEERETVRIETHAVEGFGSPYVLEMPPHSIMALGWLAKTPA